MQCTAKSKQSGERCRRHAMNERNVCYMHGGKTPRGFEHPRTKTGSQSKYLNYLPQSLRIRFDDFYADKELRNLDENIALLNVRLSQLLGQVEEGDYGSLYSQIQARAYKVQSLLDKFQRMTTKDKQEETFNELLDHYGDLMQLIETGQTQYQLWLEVRATLSDIKGTVQAISNIEYQGEKSVTVKELGQFMAGIRLLIERANLDNEQRRLISDGLMTLWDFKIEESVENE